MEVLRKFASPLLVVGFILFLLGLGYVIFDYEGVSLSTGQGWGLLVLGALWIPAAISLILGLIVRSIFKKRKIRMIVDTILLLVMIIIIALSFGGPY